MKRKEIFSPKKKNRKKIIRSILEAAVLIFLAAVIVRNMVSFRKYVPYEQTDVKIADSDETGFVAVSYFGVDRTGTNTLISTQRLKEHLDALHRSGYVTITQKDILDYYNSGKKLPEKALFLMYEDGRRDTAIFSEKIMEEYNDIATVMTYAEKFKTKDSKFLMPDDLKSLVKSSYWELGTNGYRLEYINVSDRYDNYLGRMNTLEFAEVREYLDRDYNHYLMDYIRDEYDIPMESQQQMTDRIKKDYRMLGELYTEKLGKIPSLYVLMHANTGQFGDNDKVSAVNQECIADTFSLNFNREGYSLNTRDSSMYDLTRMQPQAYWSTNHLLMRIYDDTGAQMAWVDGDTDKKEKWEEKKGKAEFKVNSIILTSEPSDTGLLKLKDADNLKNLKLETTLSGNIYGEQNIMLRTDKDGEKYISVGISNNVLSVREKNGRQEKELFSVNLDELDGIVPQSLEEDEKAALLSEKSLEIKYADSTQTAQEAKKEYDTIEQKKAETVSEGAEAYIPPVELNAPGERKLRLEIKENELSVYVDDKPAVENLEVKRTEEGGLWLMSAWGGRVYSQRNLADDVYDGIFTDLTITENTGNETENVIFNGKPEKFEKLVWEAEKMWEEVLNWFIRTF